MMIIAFLLIVLGLVLGVPVPFTFLGVAAYLVFALELDPTFLLPYASSEIRSVVLLAIPLFIMIGGITFQSGMGSTLVKWVDVVFGKVRGGLGVVSIVSCAVFGSISGSALATLSAIGSIMFPQLHANGYPKGYSAALLSSACVLGLYIPPSALMILFAWTGGQSVLACFLATVVPGIILIILLSIVNFVMLRNVKEIHVREKSPIKEDIKLFGQRGYRAAPAMMLPVIILGGIYGGIMTPTEAAAVSVLYAIPVGIFVYKGLTVRKLLDTFVSTATSTGVIMLMMFAMMMLSRVFIMEDLPHTILDYLTAVSDEKIVLLLMLNVFMILIGMLMDDVSGVLLSTPILLPVAQLIGVHPIHFAAILAINLGMGNVTPPTAPLLFLGAKLGDSNVSDMLKPTLYLILFAWLPTLLLTTYVPGLAMFLPGLILGISY